MSGGYNPDYKSDGQEGGIDTNALPWIDLPQAPGAAIKPLRASTESGWFTVVMKVARGTELAGLVNLGEMDMMVLSGAMTYPDGLMAGTLSTGTWGYAPANSRIDRLIADEDTEVLTNFHGPVAFLDDDGKGVASILTSLDIIAAARDRGIALAPNTLAECMQERPPAYTGPADPLAISSAKARARLLAEGVAADVGRSVHPYFIDTRAVPWLTLEASPDVGLKILRVSEETGTSQTIVRHNGVAGPHYHLGAADFMVLKGRIGYRAGPQEGYGPGVWFFEPAGARHEATQRIGDEDLIYTANGYGPLQFDEGPGTPIAAVVSWMTFKGMADAAGVELVRNTFPGDSSLFGWAPLGSAGARL
jgi:hypothetical protein